MTAASSWGEGLSADFRRYNRIQGCRVLYERAQRSYQQSGDVAELQQAIWTLRWRLQAVMSLIPVTSRDREMQTGCFALMELAARSCPEQAWPVDMAAVLARWRALGCAEGRT